MIRRPMMRHYLQITATILWLAAATAARAEDPCAADALKLCKDVKPGEGRIVKCLQAHDGELSGGCKAMLAKHQGAKTNGCKDDVARFCAGTKPGEGRVIACLKQHEAQLTEGCKTLVRRSGSSPQRNGTNVCAQDQARFCKDVQPGEGRVVACLRKHEAELSVACKAHLLPKPAKPAGQ